MIHVIYGNQVEDMVFRLLEKSEALNHIQRNDVVLLKPNLVFALERLRADGILSSRFTFHLGQQAKIASDSRKIDMAVGNCVISDLSADSVIAECPPSANSIYNKVASIGKSYQVLLRLNTDDNEEML